MLTFRKGMRQGPAAARRMAVHLAQPTLPSEMARRQVDLARVGFADHDGTTLAVPRADLDPVLARDLGIDPGVPLGVDAMTSILMGLRADGRPSTMSAPGRAVAYIDLCFSPDKTVSLVWAMAGDAAKAVIAESLRASVARTMAAIEGVIGVSRRGQGGRDGAER